MKISPSSGEFKACRNQVLDALKKLNDTGLWDDTLTFINKKQVTISMMNDLLAILQSDPSADTIAMVRNALQERVGCFGTFTDMSKIATELRRIKDSCGNGAHVITGNTRAAVMPVPLDGEPVSQCMIISKKTGCRCVNVNPKYKLVSSKSVYYTCGHCSQDKANAWWKTEFTRMKIR